MLFFLKKVLTKKILEIRKKSKKCRIFVLTKTNKDMQFKIKTNQPVAREKKHPEVIALSDVIISNVIKEATINKKDLFNGKQIEKSNLLMTANDVEPVYAENYYVSSDGDIIKTAIINGVKYVEVEMCEESLKHIETLCDMNVTDHTNSSGITRRRIQFEGTEIDVCQVTLGTYRNYIEKNTDFINLSVKQKRIPIPKLNENGEEISGSFTYESRIMCPAENKEEVIRLIRKLNKTIIEWF